MKVLYNLFTYFVTVLLIILGLLSLGKDLPFAPVYMAFAFLGLGLSFWQQKKHPIPSLKLIIHIILVILTVRALLPLFTTQPKQDLFAVLIRTWVYFLVLSTFIVYGRRDFYFVQGLCLGLIIYACFYATHNPMALIGYTSLFLIVWIMTLRTMNLLLEGKDQQDILADSRGIYREIKLAIILFLIVLIISLPFYFLIPRLDIPFLPVDRLLLQRYSAVYADFPKRGLVAFLSENPKDKVALTKEPEGQAASISQDAREGLIDVSTGLTKPIFWQSAQIAKVKQNIEGIDQQLKDLAIKNNLPDIAKGIKERKNLLMKEEKLLENKQELEKSLAKAKEEYLKSVEAASRLAPDKQELKSKELEQRLKASQAQIQEITEGQKELDKQLEKVEKKIQEVKELAQKYNLADIEKTLLEKQQILKERQELNKDRQALEKELTKAKQEYAKAQTAADAATLKELENKINSLQAQIQEITAGQKELDKQLEKVEKKIQEVKELAQKYNLADIEKALLEKQQILKEVQRLEKKLAQAQINYTQIIASSGAIPESSKEFEEKLRKTETEIKEILEERKELDKKISEVENKIKAIQKLARQENLPDIEKTVQEKQELLKEKQELEKKLAEAKKEYLNLAQTYDNPPPDLAGNEKALKELEEKINQGESRVQAMVQTRKALDKQIEKIENVIQQIQILAANNNLPDVERTVLQKQELLKEAQQLQKDLAEAEQSHAQAAANISIVESIKELKTLADKIQNLENQIKTAMELRNELNKKLESVENSIKQIQNLAQQKKLLDIEKIIKQIQELFSKGKELEKQIQQLQFNLAEVRDEYYQMAESTAEAESLKKLENKIKQIESQIQAMVQTRKELDKQLEILEERIKEIIGVARKNNLGDIQKVIQEKKELLKQEEDLVNSSQQLQMSLDKAKQDYTEAAASFATTGSVKQPMAKELKEKELAELENKIKELQGQIQAVTEAQAGLDKQLGKVEEKIKMIKELAKQHNVDIESVIQEMQQLLEKEQALAKDIQELEKKLAQAQQDYAQAASAASIKEMKQTQDQIQAMRQQRQGLNEELQEVKKDIETASQMAEKNNLASTQDVLRERQQLLAKDEDLKDIKKMFEEGLNKVREKYDKAKSDIEVIGILPPSGQEEAEGVGIAQKDETLSSKFGRKINLLVKTLTEGRVLAGENQIQAMIEERKNIERELEKISQKSDDIRKTVYKQALQSTQIVRQLWDEKEEQENQLKSLQQTQQKKAEPPPPPPEQKKETPKRINIFSLFLYLIVLVVLFYILGYTLLFIFPFLRHKKRIQRSCRKNQHNLSVSLVYNFLGRVLSIFDYKYPVAILPEEYLEMVKKRFAAAAYDLQNLTTLFIEARYSFHKLKPEQEREAFEYYRGILREIKIAAPFWQRQILRIGFLFKL